MAPHVIDEIGLSSKGMDLLAEDTLWPKLKNEARRMAEECPGDLDDLGSQLLPDFIEYTVLQWGSLEECLATHLSEKLAWKAASAEKICSVLLKSFRDGHSVKGDPLSSMLRKDLIVIKERDPACPSLAHALLHSKGYQGLQAYRAANWLWRKGQSSLASIFQSRVSEVFGLDIHPAAQIGGGILIDHGTGVVIGETAVVGDGCTFLHGVTLGGTGKQGGDRHPKLGSNVFIGAGASILGNVKIGECAKIGAAALVLTNIPAFATAVGCPAKIVGRVKEENPASVMDSSCAQVNKYLGKTRSFCPFRKLDCSKKGFLGPNEFATRLQNICKLPINTCQASEAFFNMDTDHDGMLTEKEFNDNLHVLQETLSKVVQLTDLSSSNTIAT
ncbi:unnamed protein product [Calypogeia fissa]